jgi:hypothetical protein
VADLELVQDAYSEAGVGLGPGRLLLCFNIALCVSFCGEFDSGTSGLDQPTRRVQAKQQAQQRLSFIAP